MMTQRFLLKDDDVSKKLRTKPSQEACVLISEKLRFRAKFSAKVQRRSLQVLHIEIRAFQLMQKLDCLIKKLTYLSLNKIAINASLLRF